MIFINKCSKYKFKNVLILLFFLYILLLNGFNYHSSPNNNNLKTIKSLDYKERDIILEKGRKFLNKCFFSENNDYYEIKYNPIMTAIIPSYNCEKTISSSIRSVQFQNNSNIELIIVDDMSTDKSKEIIMDFQVKDKRIILIENKKNMGTLYSRCIGALYSKGKYITCLDNDDLFFDEDVFDYVYKQSIMDNLDLVSFRALSSLNSFNDTSKMKDFQFFDFPNNLYLSQPELGIWTLNINGTFKLHNHMIWSKSIKSNIYKRAVNLLGYKRYTVYLCWAEDAIINFIYINLDIFIL